ncbi:hypothetical protein EX30DRAFT_360661 [Ascodesmis nigricans]|uniref:Uncharacterized protein n=1 Tax=Ascodesmis nigricans TaxID=341454 RepID=A0A4S2N5R3_9PEZI|nr:hypothetical protein EX30DRAFT_360661 [Ascodesmis nigricans]
MSDTDGTPFGTPEGSSYTPSASSGSLPDSTPSIIDHPSTPTRDSALSSIDSSSSSDDSDYDDSDAEQEWRESLHQLELLVSLVLIPFFGKWVGRKCAYWAWARFMTWKHPGMDIVVTSKATQNIAGVVGILSSPGGVRAPM